ncbi:alpha/beta hydrolase [Planctomycetes bacterium K23_9]|uniref:Alpha/beta hydrolase family protein n=1 Tax=Stieleria marina TaxID=1930275 RepID=A0A517P2Q9_9BACT|nr:hypothetical protein K239x_56850 [Planctomycetes bacterium K23_9]
MVSNQLLKRTLLSSVFYGMVLLTVGCGAQADSSSTPPDRDSDSIGEVGATDHLQSSVAEEPLQSESFQIEPLQVESAELSLQPGSASGGRAGLSKKSVRLDQSITKVPEAMAMESAAMAIEPPRASPPPPKASQSMESLPAGSIKHDEEKFARVKVFYATDRAPSPTPLSAYRISGDTQLMQTLAGASVVLFLVAGVGWVIRRPRLSAGTTALGLATTAASVAFFLMGRTTIEKHGVDYLGDRGVLTRGVCEVTVPVVHERGIVERPSLLRFEFREDQDKHVVLTHAVEMQRDHFYQKLSTTVADSKERDLLVFIHGYNVDFDSAVQRTAQISVDLPFEGVPICYSWPSQGQLLSYSIDENNAMWTVTHLREFLLELASQSGADSINVVAHSMGNRAMTMAMQQIQHQSSPGADPIFDRVVLAAPDVDADRFRRDLAPSLLSVANQVTLYASSDDRALIASKKVHGYPRAGESGADLVVVPGVETIDVSGIDLSLLGHSYYGENDSMLRDLYDVVRARLPAPRRPSLIARQAGALTYWQLAKKPPQAFDR